jgi:cell division protein FtsQ
VATNIRSSVASRGASIVSQSKMKKLPSVGSLSVISAVFKPYAGILAVLFIMLMLATFKTELLGLVDHNIEQISVHGELNKVDAGAVSEKISPWLQGSFLTADLNEIKTQVDELPWVKTSTVSRVWPGEIAIGTTEQVPVAFWNAGSYINGDGEVFTPAVLNWEGALPKLVGPDSFSVSQKLGVLAQLASLQALVEPNGLVIVELRLRSRGAWEVTLGNGIVVALGSPPFEEKVARMVAVLEGASAENQARMKKIDSRYPNGLAIKWKLEAPTE